MKRMAIIVAALATLTVIGTSSAFGAEFVIPIDTVVRADEGSITLLETETTPSELVGSTCVGIAVAGNQESVHPNNDLIIASGGASVVLEDVEREPNVVTDATGSITLGETVSVSLRMGPDEVFSGGLLIEIGGNCTPVTTTTTPAPTTTTTLGSTTTVPGEPPAVIEIVKDATPERYGADGIGNFTITVTNPGPVDLTMVRVTDDIALAQDPTSDCANPALPDLAVGESFTYQCTVGGLDGVSPFTNEATAIGKPPTGPEVTDTDTATVVPPVQNTTITQAPTTSEAPPTTETTESTLPVTGFDTEQVRGFASLVSASCSQA